VLGSGSIVQQLANERLIDEYIFIVTPVVAGDGKRLFSNVTQLDLTLNASKHLNLETSFYIIFVNNGERLAGN